MNADPSGQWLAFGEKGAIAVSRSSSQIMRRIRVHGMISSRKSQKVFSRFGLVGPKSKT
jgi:hypothetical protein